MLLKLLTAALVLYGLVVLLFALLQTRHLYPAYAMPQPASIPSGWEQLSAATPDGVTLAGVHVPPTRASSERLLVLVFPGNAWNAADAAALTHQIYPTAHVVAFHYRGYAPSGGRASSAALLRDAPLVLQAARDRVGPARTLVAGFSVGTGVAASLAGQGAVEGAILVTPFDSLMAVARSHYPWLPVRLLFRQDMNAAGAVARSRVPVAIIAAGRDRIIPARSTDALRRAVPRLVFDRTIAGAGHNDLYELPDFENAMIEARSAILVRGSGQPAPQ